MLVAHLKQGRGSTACVAERGAARHGFVLSRGGWGRLMIPGVALEASPADFYDDLAEDYHLIFADWNATIARQAEVITGLLRAEHGLLSGRVLDASCGIGTQALGLAAREFEVTASDISAVSVRRCAREAASRGLSITTAVADVRVLDVPNAGEFDVALSFDNALPHLLDDDALTTACVALRRVLRPGGVLLASIRDYDAIVQQRPSGDPPRSFPTELGERISFQVWDWLSQDRYTLRHFTMQSSGGDWAVLERRTAYRALTRPVLSSALAAAGFKNIVWQMPDQTGFYQPIVSAIANA